MPESNLAGICVNFGAGVLSLFLALCIMSELPVKAKWCTYLIYSVSFVCIALIFRLLPFAEAAIYMNVLEWAAMIWSSYKLLGFSLVRSFGVYGASLVISVLCSLTYLFLS